MMCAVFFALGYGTRVLHERAGHYDFRPQLDTTTNGSVSSNHSEAAPLPIQHLSHGASLIPPGSILLQVAASPRESDALTMADTLRQKGFAVLVLEPTADNFYRVEVGPYTDAHPRTWLSWRSTARAFKSSCRATEPVRWRIANS